MKSSLSKQSSAQARLSFWLMSASFFLGAVIVGHQENGWTAWVLIVAGLVFNLDYRWRLKPELHSLLIEPRYLQVIGWVISSVLLLVAVLELSREAIDVGSITATASLCLNPELRRWMKLKLLPEKVAKIK
ncbi:MAG: hypothetical protein MH252_06000 [Thermosynechococcaceae cyanobacterium MS004]|nr:hypothetical protein [Thermosynechococcaceae cyanobacterium MS004]